MRYNFKFTTTAGVLGIISVGDVQDKTHLDRISDTLANNGATGFFIGETPELGGLIPFVNLAHVSHGWLEPAE